MRSGVELRPVISKFESRIDAVDEKLESRIEAVDEKLESRIESIDSRLLLLDTLVDGITPRLFENSQSPLESRMGDLNRKLELLDSRVDRLLEYSQKLQLDELSDRLDGQQSQLEKLAAKLDRQTPQLYMVTSKTNSQESQLDEVDIKVNSQKSQLDGIAAKVNNQTSRLETLTTRLATQESQVTRIVKNVDHQQTQLVLLNDTLNIEQSRLDGATTETTSQQTQIAELAVRLDRVEHIVRPRDCSELPAEATTGIHLLCPLYSTVEAYCDMDADGGNWTVIQRRDDIKPRQDFYLGWTDYKRGFGNLEEEFWWGLNYLWQMTSAHGRRFELRIDLEDYNGSTKYAIYQDFSISDEDDGYRLRASNYTGDAKDSLEDSVNWPFSTRDRDRDGWSSRNCAEIRQGGWWYNRCTFSNLNGHHLEGVGDGHAGIYWYDWKGHESLKKTEMKIRPT